LTDNGKFVLPGDTIGISEEFMPGAWAYEEEGSIYAAVTGTVETNMEERMINVLPKVSTPPNVKNGDILFGSVWDVKSQLVLLDIIKIKGNDRGLAGKVKGALHVSKVREGYVSDISREFSQGDVVMAEVVDANREPLELTTAGKTLGVVHATCSRCGGAMKPEKNGLKCAECKRFESRKLSSEYGKVIV